ncbi:chromosome segregation protein SMC [Sphingobacteriaceae bacterium]|nr:chromosome segregation protein SMC [Sphingobacteriaceae bacterium]
MEIKELKIQNYKSIKDISIKNPNPFTVFVGPNAAGKSNIFEALEFYTTISQNVGNNVTRLFGDINHYNHEKSGGPWENVFQSKFERFESEISLSVQDNGVISSGSKSFFSTQLNKQIFIEKKLYIYWEDSNYIQFFNAFSRIFVANTKIEKFAFEDDKRLSLSCGNLEQVLKRILFNKIKNEEIVEWLELLIPGFKNIEIKTEELSGSTNLLIYEKGIQKPLTKKIISDGTYNIIAILTALYKSDEPQFLCIEEPENGLNPKVVRELVNIFRQQCKEKGHFIWLNTHSQTIVSELTNDEIILVDKIDGETKIKQIQGMDLHGLRMDEALLTNAIGGGIPW